MLYMINNVFLSLLLHLKPHNMYDLPCYLSVFEQTLGVVWCMNSWCNSQSAAYIEEVYSLLVMASL